MCIVSERNVASQAGCGKAPFVAAADHRGDFPCPPGAQAGGPGAKHWLLRPASRHLPCHPGQVGHLLVTFSAPSCDTQKKSLVSEMNYASFVILVHISCLTTGENRTGGVIDRRSVTMSDGFHDFHGNIVVQIPSIQSEWRDTSDVSDTESAFQLHSSRFQQKPVIPRQV